MTATAPACTESDSSNLLEGECTPDEFRAFLRSVGFTEEGWIDDKGNFWPCTGDMLHGFVASCILDLSEQDAEKAADRLGWLRISDYGNRTTARELNQRQLNKLFDFCTYYGCDFEEVKGSIQSL